MKRGVKKLRDRDVKDKAIEDLRNKDIAKYVAEVNKIREETIKKDEDNVVKTVESFDKLTVKEKNTLIDLFNLMLEDKGKWGGKLWNQIQAYTKEGKLTN